MRDRFRELLRRHLQPPQGQRLRRRRAQLRPPKRQTLRHHPGVARRHLGGDRRRGLHAHREHALHRRGLRRLFRSPERERHPDDHALGLRRPAAGVARAGGVRAPRLRPALATGHRAIRARWRRSCSRTRRLPTRSRPAGRRHALGSAFACCTRRIDRRGHVDGDAEGRPTNRRPADYARLIMRRRPAAVLRRLPAGYPSDHRRSPVFLPHHQARRSVPGRVRPIDAVRQRPERAADADGHLGRAGAAVRGRTARDWRAVTGASGFRRSSTSERSAPDSC